MSAVERSSSSTRPCRPPRAPPPRAGRDLACARAAHAVRDGEERRLADERVLVPHAPAARVGHAALRARSSRLHLQLGLADPDDVAGLREPCLLQPACRSRTCRSWSRDRRPTLRPGAARCARGATTRTRRARGGCRSPRRARRRSGAATSIVPPCSELRAREDEEARRARARARRAARSASAAPRMMLSCGACVHPLRRRAHDEEDERVEQHEERDLPDQERLVGLERERASRRKRAAEHDLRRAERDAGRRRAAVLGRRACR